jgi:alpha-galactosidase
MTKTLPLIALILCSTLLAGKDRGAVAEEAIAVPVLARTPPMGWNSWDSYGTTVTEADVRSAAQWIAAHLKPYGWQYIVVDMEWFVKNPTPAGNSKNSQFSIDEHGRYAPAPNRFLSAANGAGFKPLADYVHSLGLKFGLHILRGIPKQAVENNQPIADSPYHAADAADLSDGCPWNPDNYGVDVKKAAARAYYDSIARLYAQWGADLVKVDCIASHPYKGDEIRMLSMALRRTGRPIVLSLSPGPVPLEKIEEMRRYAEMWRVSDDVWDLWHSTMPYPQGLGDQFPRLARWAMHSSPGHWPDADMLPLGYLGPAPGWGTPRLTRLTREEQRTLMTLWCIFQSPLMWGGNPIESDDWTVSLLTNSEVLEADQHSTWSRVVFENDKIVAWFAQPTRGKGNYVAAFNLQETPQKARLAWKEMSLPEGKYLLRNLWQHNDLGAATALEVDLPPHGSVLYRVTLQ